MASDHESRLQERVSELEGELSVLKEEMRRLMHISASKIVADTNVAHVTPNQDCHLKELHKQHIERYSRQLLLPEFGVEGQLHLANSSVLIVGAGGLGCPAALYLAAAGIGRLGIVDYDQVELSNLHRQVLHSEAGVGVSKALSAKASVHRLNSNIRCETHCILLNSTNALDIVNRYDVVVDATDNVATRYLLNDACVLSGKPLVSGGALRFEGQLTTYHYQGGPCYRCLYPEPPLPDTVTNCSDGGVIGAVPGVIGCLQALEVINMISRGQASYSQRLLMFDGETGSFQTIRLRFRQPHCAVCGEKPTITKLVDYVQFCGTSPTDKAESIHLLGDENRISCYEYSKIKEMGIPHILLDVRETVQYNMCRLPESYHMPLDDLMKMTSDQIQDVLKAAKDKAGLTQDTLPPIYAVCRRGNDSQRAIDFMLNCLPEKSRPDMFDLRDGLQAWSNEVDPDFPVY